MCLMAKQFVPKLTIMPKNYFEEYYTGFYILLDLLNTTIYFIYYLCKKSYITYIHFFVSSYSISIIYIERIYLFLTLY